MNPQSLDILYEDAHIIVCVKPSGIATQSKNMTRPDMVSILKNHIVQTRSHSRVPSEPYLAVIHRLDQPVRGIMVFSKTPCATRELNRELTESGFEKYYRALVLGRPPQNEAVLENYLVKDAKTNHSHICEKDTPAAKLARLSYKIVPDSARFFTELPSCDGALLTELDIRLLTGRHHQIRVQLAGLGCPIIGDTKYNPNAAYSKNIQCLYLCSCLLRFTHPKTKKTMQFSLLQN